MFRKLQYIALLVERSKCVYCYEKPRDGLGGHGRGHSHMAQALPGVCVCVSVQEGASIERRERLSGFSQERVHVKKRG